MKKNNVDNIEIRENLDLAEKDILIKTRLNPTIEHNLAIKENQYKLVKYVGAYRDRNINTLSSPYILDTMYFLQEDYQILYTITQCEEEYVSKLIKQTKSPTKNEIKNFKPFPTVCQLALGYFLRTNNTKLFQVLSLYYAYSFYWTIYDKFFPYDIKPEIMKYVVNEMSNKYSLKANGSLEMSLKLTMNKLLETYSKMLIRANDSDIRYVISQVKTRLRNSIHNVADAYHIACKKGKVMYSTTEIDDEGHSIENAGLSNNVITFTNSCVTNFFASEVDLKIAKRSAKLWVVDDMSLTGTISLLKENDLINDVKQFYESIFYLYFKEGGTVEDIYSIKFLAKMHNIYKKGNSKDQNIIKIKKLTDKWLKEGCNSYRTASSETTKNNYRKAIFWYMIELVSSSKTI